RGRVACGRDDPAARTSCRPASGDSVAEGEGTDAGAMAEPGLAAVVLLGRRQLQRSRQLEVIERAARKFLEPAVRTPYPVRAGAVRERHFGTEPREHAVPRAIDTH